MAKPSRSPWRPPRAGAWSSAARTGRRSCRASMKSGRFLLTVRPRSSAFAIPSGKASAPAVTNRRRVTEHDSLAENQSLLIVIQAQPDRVDEPVAVVINNNDEGHLKAMTSEAWLELFDGVRDALELLAVRELKKAFATAA